MKSPIITFIKEDYPVFCDLFGTLKLSGSTVRSSALTHITSAPVHLQSVARLRAEC